MSWDGMLAPEGTVGCERCGKPLNPNGHRPAELYAGTFTGLCYSCERSKAFCVKVELLDRAEHWEFPPHCPSYRREREHFIGYANCPECDGRGSKWVSRPDSRGGPYRTYCDTCFNRYYKHPIRKRIDQRHQRLQNAAKNAIVTYLIDNKMASKRKRRNDTTGIKLKDHNQKTIWLYCEQERVREISQQYLDRARLVFQQTRDQMLSSKKIVVRERIDVRRSTK